eukprot:scaffold218461_cov41-Prasinocladus_malaysianus.AAC.1
MKDYQGIPALAPSASICGVESRRGASSMYEYEKESRKTGCWDAKHEGLRRKCQDGRNFKGSNYSMLKRCSGCGLSLNDNSQSWGSLASS